MDTKMLMWTLGSVAFPLATALSSQTQPIPGWVWHVWWIVAAVGLLASVRAFIVRFGRWIRVRGAVPQDAIGLWAAAPLKLADGRHISGTVYPTNRREVGWFLRGAKIVVLVRDGGAQVAEQWLGDVQVDAFRRTPEGVNIDLHLVDVLPHDEKLIAYITAKRGRLAGSFFYRDLQLTSAGLENYLRTPKDTP